MNIEQLSNALRWIKSQRWTVLFTLSLFSFSTNLMAAENIEALAAHDASGVFGFLFSYIAHNPFVFLLDRKSVV